MKQDRLSSIQGRMRAAVEGLDTIDRILNDGEGSWGAIGTAAESIRGEIDEAQAEIQLELNDLANAPTGRIVALESALGAIIEAARMSDQPRAIYCGEIAKAALEGSN